MSKWQLTEHRLANPEFSDEIWAEATRNGNTITDENNNATNVGMKEGFLSLQKPQHILKYHLSALIEEQTVLK